MLIRTLPLIVALHLALSGACWALEKSLPKSFISFKEAEALAIQNSHAIASQEYAVKSARESARAQKVKRYPTLSFGAESTFMSKIGQISLPQLGVNRNIGDHINWSTGPAIDAVLWDTGQITNMAKSLEKTADAQHNNLDSRARQVLLAVRAAYIGVQLTEEQVCLVTDALRLARAQYADVAEKNRVGTADTLDLTVAHQEVVDREKDLENTRGELGVAKRTLVAALGYDATIEKSDALTVEPLADVLDLMLPRAGTPVDIEAHPTIKALTDQEQSASFAAKSSSARHWPKVVARGSSTFEYPNLGANNIIQQNKATLGLHVPILDWGMISKESRSYTYQAHSANERRGQAAIDLAREESEIRERIRTLKELRTANRKAVKDAVAVARLTYDSFQAGRLIFLDVQRANVKALSVKVDSARTDAELAVQIAKLLSMAENEGVTP